MRQTEVAEISQRVKRISHRIKNADNSLLHKEALQIANRIARKKTSEEALLIEQKFINKMQEIYNVETPTGILTHAPISNLAADAYGDDDAQAAKDLKSTADDAFKSYADNCSGSVAEVASKGFDISDLNGKQANDQVGFMDSNWDFVDGRTAQDLANKGELVVAGLKNPNGDGHVAVVVPGQGSSKPDGKFYPNVEGGGGTNGKSDGSKTAGDVWPSKNTDPQYRGNVKYYKPKD
jgi:hypothetical protein